MNSNHVPTRISKDFMFDAAPFVHVLPENLYVVAPILPTRYRDMVSSFWICLTVKMLSNMNMSC